MILRVKSIQAQKKKLSLSTKALQSKIKDVIEDGGVMKTEDESNDLENIVEAQIPTEVDQQSSNFQKILWEQQKQYNTLAKKKQMKWHPLMIRFALSLHYASKSAYSFIANSGILSLSSERTIYTLVYH